MECSDEGKMIRGQQTDSYSNVLKGGFMKKISMVLIVTILFLMVTIMAQSEEIHRKGPCKADFEKFCKDVKPGQGRLVKCMKEHENELSPACRDKIEVDREKAQEFIKACKPDTDKFCKDIKPGHGRIIKCLKQNEAQLSAPCNAYFQQK
jgi:hypothetical protein